MNILFVLENFHPHIGGVETLFKNLCQALAIKGCEVHVLTTRKDKSHLQYEILNEVHIHRVPYSNRYLFTFLSAIPAIKLARNADMIHTTSYNAALPAWIAATLTRKPSLITFHEVWAKLWYEMPFMSKIGQLVHYVFEQIILKLNFKTYIGVSDYTCKALAANGIPNHKIQRIYNGLIYEDFKSKKIIPKETFTFTFFGRLGMSKGLNLIVDAAAKLKASHPDVIVQLIIPMQPEGFLKDLFRLIDELDLRNHILIKHHLSFEDLKQEIVSSSCILIPSYSEGFCFAAVETMALKTPIISSARGALAEVIGGKYIEMENQSSEALYKAMLLAIEGKWKEKSYRKFEMNVTVDAYLALYNHLATS